MLLKNLNIFYEQVITYLQKDGKLSKEECGAAIAAADCGSVIDGGGSASMTTGQTFGPDTPETSIANTMKQPPKCPHHGRAGITTRDILPMYSPALPYKSFRFLNKKKKRKKKI